MTFEEFKKLAMDARAKPRETYEQFSARHEKSLHLDLVSRAILPQIIVMMEWTREILKESVSNEEMDEVVREMDSILEHY